MATRLTADDARESLRAHVADKGLEINLKYGPEIGWAEIQRLLQDRTYVRYPCEIIFDAHPLLPGEVAYPAPNGARPEDGFRMHVHPSFAADLDRVPWLVCYQLVAVNYGEFASPEDAEIFGAAVLGLDRETYYQKLCEMVDRVLSA